MPIGNRILLPILALSATTAGAAGYDIDALRQAATEDGIAWDIAEGLTTEIGARPAGSAAEARARDWAVAKLTALGFSNPRIEPFVMPIWTRGLDSAEILAPFPQRLIVAALGNSGPTPAEGITGEVVAFSGIMALERAPDDMVRGKIVYVTHGMSATQDGSSYGAFGPVRRTAPSIASRKGAIGIVIRSLGTDRSRAPHTGSQTWAKDVKPIPAGALSNSDAAQLERVMKRGRPVTLKLVLTGGPTKPGQSGNVIAEVPGRDPRAGMILVACHLDSWDLGTGAIDDAAGCGIVTAAAKRVMDAGQPLRTIRVVWFGAEEVGLLGGYAYLARHGAAGHAAVAESDLGADRVWTFNYKVGTSAEPLMRRAAEALVPLGVTPGVNGKGEGSDITPLIDAGVPVLSLEQDATRYFELHHTPEDTLEQIDPVALRQNVAAWTTVLATVADSAEPLDR